MSDNKERQFSFTFASEVSVNEFKTDGCSFLPAAGNRATGSTTMNNVGTNGNYWSSTPDATTTAYNLNFNSSNINMNSNNRGNGFTVRCVSASTDVAFTPSCFVLSKEQLLIDLIRAYYDARRHKRNTINQLRFEFQMEEELVNLRNELYERTYQVGRSTCFIVEKPKKREIFAACFRDRVVHHLLCNYISPLFERTFIADSYSCRKNKGTLYGVMRLAHHIRRCSDNYSYACHVLKLDIQGYFMSINRQNLLSRCETELRKQACRHSNIDGLLWREVIDLNFVLYLLRILINNDPTERCLIKSPQKDWKGLPNDKSLFYTPKNCGLPIGNLTSQFFSNIYLNSLDQFVKRSLCEQHYGRYVDDFYIVSRSHVRLLSDLDEIHTFLCKELGLRLNFKKTKLIRVDYGVDFLGVFVKPYRLYIDNKVKKRISNIMNNPYLYDDSTILCNQVNSYLGYMKHFKCIKFARNLFGRNVILNDVGNFDKVYGKFSLK